MGPPAEEFGPYVVYEQLGLGGMATVHRAETQGIAGFSKQVALKRMLPSVASDASLVKSFIREARLASHLRHANVAQTYDLGKVGEIYFIAMELVPGRNLREILQHCATSSIRIPLPIAMNIVTQICDALDYAHNLCDESGQPLGIIHRDVSPSNVIVGEGGIVKLIDFGIAKASARSGMHTQTGTIKGKFGYMAPEYLMGSLDARADLFALGVIAHELLSNRPLFQGKDDMDTLYRVKDMPILPPSRINPTVPPELDAVIMTALERNPEQRWQGASALRQALTTVTTRLGLVAHNAEVIAWIEHVFAPRQNRSDFDVDSEPAISITTGTTELPSARVPDEFSSNDGQETLVNPVRARIDDWNVATDTTVPASAAIDAPVPVADPTKLVRKSRAQTAVADPQLVDTMRDRASTAVDPNLVDTKRDRTPAGARASSPHVVRRNTPAPFAQHTPAPRVERASEPAMAAGTPASLPPQPALMRTLPGAGPASLPPRPVLDDLAARAERPSAARLLGTPDLSPQDTVAKTRVEPGKTPRSGNFLLAVLVLIAAGGAAAVVYFALPYLT